MTRLQFLGAMIAAPFAALFGRKQVAASTPVSARHSDKRYWKNVERLYAERRRLHELSGFARENELGSPTDGEFGVAAAMAVDDAAMIHLLGSTIRYMAKMDPKCAEAYGRYESGNGYATEVANLVLRRYAEAIGFPGDGSVPVQSMSDYEFVQLLPHD